MPATARSRSARSRAAVRAAARDETADRHRNGYRHRQDRGVRDADARARRHLLEADPGGNRGGHGPSARRGPDGLARGAFPAGALCVARTAVAAPRRRTGRRRNQRRDDLDLPDGYPARPPSHHRGRGRRARPHQPADAAGRAVRPLACAGRALRAHAASARSIIRCCRSKPCGAAASTCWGSCSSASSMPDSERTIVEFGGTRSLGPPADPAERWMRHALQTAFAASFDRRDFEVRR